MTKFGYAAYTFRVRKPRGEPLVLGTFDGSRDALPVLYGCLCGLERTSIVERTRHLRARQVTGLGRTIPFSIEIGNSGQTSQFFDPDDDPGKPVFERADRHIETGVRRCLLVVPERATTGLLITEIRGRTGAKSLLAPALGRLFRHHTDHVLDVAAVVDEEALQQYLTQAEVKDITLRRSGMPSDIAEAVEFSTTEADAGKLEMKIKSPGRAKEAQRRLVERLRGDDGARRRLLTVYGMDFDELSVAMEVGERKTTLTVTADRIPSFVYDLPTRRSPTDTEFYTEIRRAVPEIARAVGATLGQDWQAGDWSEDALGMVLPVPLEVAEDGLRSVGS